MNLDSLVLAGEAFPGGLTARPNGLADSRPSDLILSQEVDRALKLVFGLLQAGRIDAKLLQQHFRHLAIGPDREFAGLPIRLQDLVAKHHALVADEDTWTRHDPADLVLAFTTKGAAP